MSQELASRYCEACAPGTPPIDEDRAVEHEVQLDPPGPGGHGPAPGAS